VCVAHTNLNSGIIMYLCKTALYNQRRRNLSSCVRMCMDCIFSKKVRNKFSWKNISKKGSAKFLPGARPPGEVISCPIVPFSLFSFTCCGARRNQRVFLSPLPARNRVLDLFGLRGLTVLLKKFLNSAPFQVITTKPQIML